MPTQYSISDLIDSRNSRLYGKIRKRRRIELFRSDDQFWNAKLEKKRALIGYASSTYPVSCFTHELLHIQLELDGLQMPRVCHEYEGVDFLRFMPVIYNQLAHHKMFPTFTNLGFPASEFLDDRDSEEIDEWLAREIDSSGANMEHLPRIQHKLRLALPYLMVKSPHDEERLASQAVEKLRDLSDPEMLVAIDKLLRAWASEASLDVRTPFARFLKACGVPRIAFSRDERGSDQVVAQAVEDA